MIAPRPALRVVRVAWAMPAVATALGAWTERRGLLVVADVAGATGLGEASPLPGMSADDIDGCAAALARAAAGVAAWPVDAPDDRVAAAVIGAAEAACAGAPAAAWGAACAVLDAVARARGRSLAWLLGSGGGDGDGDGGGGGDGDGDGGGGGDGDGGGDGGGDGDGGGGGDGYGQVRVPLGALCAGPDEARAAVARGVRCVKIKLGAGGDRSIATAARAVAAVRAAIGPGTELRADANRAFALADVPALLAALAPHGVAYVEEPAAGVGEALAAGAGPWATPVALDESAAPPDADAWLDRALGSGAVAALVIKPTVVGPRRALALAARARAAGVAVVVTHTLDGPVSTAAAAELALALAGGAPSPPAAGLAAHAGLAAWDVPIPTIADAWVTDAPARRGSGLSVDRTLAAARRLEAPP